MSFASRVLIGSLCTVTLSGCVRGLTQVAGTGAIYHTRCSADMILEGAEYRAQCVPAPCMTNFTSGPVGHIVVAMDPGRKIIGMAERVCIQDLARSSGLFNPALVEPPSPEASDGTDENTP